MVDYSLISDAYTPENKYFNQIKPGDIFKTKEGIWYLKLHEPNQALTLHKTSIHDAFEVVSFTGVEEYDEEYTVYTEYVLRKNDNKVR